MKSEKKFALIILRLCVPYNPDVWMQSTFQLHIVSVAGIKSATKDGKRKKMIEHFTAN
jgi:hypothetical protein